ncbi:beta-1,3-N-acetylglucosaminyltransferase 5 [Paragonimus westermani]|uniref:Hexosyltransferase n=1 Tax=Paragonimus westermani TaxID=34504 RepID=A0A5J4NIM1_9TREM|nr:beta-1,3-N-acetylglucosaminyltransferase 5 [Paragonimus westermani]
MKQQLCSASVQPTVLIVIRSTPNQRVKRDAIRTTWGNPCTYDTQKVELLFLVGRHIGLNSASVDLDLQLEYRHFRDIVQYDSADSYRLLPNKQKAAFHLINEDFLVNISNLVDYILQLHTNDYMSFVGGHLYGSSAPIRDNTSKYYVSLERYPNRTFPPFVAGGATLMATSLAGKILSEMPKLKTQLHLEDVNLGMILKKIDNISSNAPLFADDPKILNVSDPSVPQTDLDVIKRRPEDWNSPPNNSKQEKIPLGSESDSDFWFLNAVSILRCTPNIVAAPTTFQPLTVISEYPSILDTGNLECYCDGLLEPFL